MYKIATNALNSFRLLYRYQNFINFSGHVARIGGGGVEKEEVTLRNTQAQM